MKNGSNRGLLRVLGLRDSMALSIGIVIGVGIFRVPSEVAQYLPSAELIMLAWLIGGIISLMGCGCYGELSSLFPWSGGEYVYIRESYSPFTGFLYGWANITVVRPGIAAAIAFIFSEYLAALLSVDVRFVRPVAVGTILLLSFINMLGLKKGKKLQNISVVAKVAILGLLIVLGIFSGKGDLSNFAPRPLPETANLFTLMGLALVPILWTYGGWNETTFVGDETLDASRTMPRAMIRSVFVITVLYLLMNMVYIYLLPANELAGADLVISDVMRTLFGPWARKSAEALVIISALSVLNGTIMTSSRLTYAVGLDTPAFGGLGHVHRTYGTPAVSLGANALLSGVFIILGTFEMLIFFTGILFWLFMGMIALGVIILRIKRPGEIRTYRVRGYPFTPIIFAIVSFALAADILIFYPRQSVIGILIMLTGAPVYWFVKRLGRISLP
jgi:APA family basic amino acid/polyamine antiporter